METKPMIIILVDKSHEECGQEKQDERNGKSLTLEKMGLLTIVNKKSEENEHGGHEGVIGCKGPHKPWLHGAKDGDE